MEIHWLALGHRYTAGNHVVITMTSDMAKQIRETLASAKSGNYTWDDFDRFEIKVNPVEITPAIDMQIAMKQAKDLFKKSSEGD